MAADDFTWLPSWQYEEAHQPRVLSAKYGDGYEQRAADGLNTDPMAFNLQFNVRSDAEAAAIINFFKDRGGVSYFTWTPPGLSQTKFICRKYNRLRNQIDDNNVTATFEQVFDQ